MSVSTQELKYRITIAKGKPQQTQVECVEIIKRLVNKI